MCSDVSREERSNSLPPATDIRFYTYALLYPEDHRWSGDFAYIGKGQGNRCNDHQWIHLSGRKSAKSGNVLLGSLFRKYGPLPVIKLAYFCSEAEAHKDEMLRIRELGRRDLKTGKLCNLTDGGEGSTGWIAPEHVKAKMRGREISETTREKLRIIRTGTRASAETRKKLSQLHLGRVKSQETRDKLRDAFKGRKLSPSQVELMRERATGKIHTAETRQKMSAARIGRKHSSETIEKIREGNKGKVTSPEVRKKIGAAISGKKLTSEHAAKLVEAARERNIGRKLSKEHTAKMREFRLGKPLSEATRQRMSDAHKRRWAAINEGRIQG